jgi:hypothetical protein
VESSGARAHVYDVKRSHKRHVVCNARRFAAAQRIGSEAGVATGPREADRSAA